MTATGDIEIHWAENLPTGVRGMTDGTRTIWLRAGMLGREVRATLIHEAWHVAMGHTGCVSGAEEDRVRWKAAQYLLPDPHPVIDALIAVEGNVAVAAVELYVDRATVVARLNRKYMHPAEAALFQNRLAGIGIAVGA